MVLQLLVSDGLHVRHWIKRIFFIRLSFIVFPFPNFILAPILFLPKFFAPLFYDNECHNECLQFLNVLPPISATSASSGVNRNFGFLPFLPREGVHFLLFATSAREASMTANKWESEQAIRSLFLRYELQWHSFSLRLRGWRGEVVLTIPAPFLFQW